MPPLFRVLLVLLCGGCGLDVAALLPASQPVPSLCLPQVRHWHSWRRGGKCSRTGLLPAPQGCLALPVPAHACLPHAAVHAAPAASLPLSPSVAARGAAFAADVAGTERQWASHALLSAGTPTCSWWPTRAHMCRPWPLFRSSSFQRSTSAPSLARRTPTHVSRQPFACLVGQPPAPRSVIAPPHTPMCLARHSLPGCQPGGRKFTSRSVDPVCCIKQP